MVTGSTACPSTRWPRGVARLHAGDLERNHVIAQQRHQPADGPDERSVPLPFQYHRLRPLDLQNQIGQFARQDRRGRLSLGSFCKAKYSPLAVASSPAGRPSCPSSWRTRAAPAPADFAGPMHQLFDIRLALEQSFGAQHQPARRGIHAC